MIDYFKEVHKLTFICAHTLLKLLEDLHQSE